MQLKLYEMFERKQFPVAELL